MKYGCEQPRYIVPVKHKVSIVSDFKPDIWRLQAQLNTQGLVEALSNRDAGIRRRAAAALRALGAVKAIPALRAILQQEQEEETRAHILAALEALEQEQERQNNPAATDTSEQPAVETELQRLIRQLKSDNPDKVIEAASALGQMKNKEAVAPLVLLFNDHELSIKVRLVVAEALLNLESAPVEVALLGALRSPEWRIRRNGIAILGQLKADWAVEPLANALADPHDVVRRTAYAALKHINTPDALKALANAPEPPVKLNKPIPTAPPAAPSPPAVGPDDPTQPSPPAQTPAAEDSTAPPGDDTESQKLAWPKRKKEDEAQQRSMMMTKPLDPDALDEARARFEQMKQQNRPEDES